MSHFHTADRMKGLSKSSFDMLRKAKELERSGREMIHLEVGEPDFDTPEHIKEAAKKALDDNLTHYAPPQGLLELREAIAEDEKTRKGIDASPDNIVVTPGAKPMIFFTIMVLSQKGDEVIYPDPGYTYYRSMIKLAGAKPVPLELKEENDFALDVDKLESIISSRTRIIILNTPHNPTGSILTMKDFEAVAEIAEKYNLVIISDEIYSRQLYEGEHVSIATLQKMKERTVVVDGFSKAYAMTGWRLGYGIVPDEILPKIIKLQTETVSCVAPFVQMAGIAALKGDQEPVRWMVEKFRQRRDLLISILEESKHITVKRPRGAFYLFPNIKKLGISSYEFTDILLDRYGVSVLPGSAFGLYGEGYIRISYATSEENLRKGAQKIVKAAEYVFNLKQKEK